MPDNRDFLRHQVQKIHKCNRLLGRLLLPAFLVLLLGSCATAPRIADAPLGGFPGGADFSVLPPGARVYLWADVKEARPLLEALSMGGISGRDAADILEKTDTAAAAFYPEEAVRRFFLAGWGSYPSWQAGISMTFSRDWKKLKSPTGKGYWYSKSSGIGAAIGSKLVYAADGDPFASVQGGAVESPGGFEEFRGGCVLAGWIPEPREPVNRFLSAAEIPIQFPAEEFFFGAARVQGGGETGEAWEPVFRMRAPAAEQARAIVSLFALARMFMGETAGEGPAAILQVLFASQPVQEGSDISLTLEAMSTEKTALLFNTFSVYFDHNDFFRNYR